MSKTILNSSSKECNNKTCPWQGGYGLSGGVRKIIHNPNKILEKYIKPGMCVLDSGCGMGYMAIPAADLVGMTGTVIGVDIQQQMLDEMEKRAKKQNQNKVIHPVKCTQTSLEIQQYNSKVDFAYAFMMIHEVDDKKKLLMDIYHALKQEGKLLIAEPFIHVSKKNFVDTVNVAEKVGFNIIQENCHINICRSVMLIK